MKEYQDDYIDDSEQETFVAQPTVVLDKISIADYIIAASLGVGVFFLLTLWAFPALEPAVWQDAAEAAGTRPPKNIFPGIWRIFAAGVFKVMSINDGLGCLSVLGRAGIALSTGFAYLMFRSIMALSLRLRLQYSRARYLVARVAAAVGAVLFACADPVWHAGQFFSPVTLSVVLSVFGLYLFFTFLQGGRLSVVYAAMFVLGVLSAETPLGILLLVLCWSVYFMAARHVLSFEMPLMNPFIEQISKWHMTFLFVLGFAGGIVCNCVSFVQAGGLEASGFESGDLPLKYAVHMWSHVTTCASAVGWLIALGVVIAPTLVCIVLLPRAADEEQFLPYHIGAVYLFAGLLALAQFSGIDALWFWTWISIPRMVDSEILLCMFMFALASIAVFALAVLGIDTLCRNHRRLALQRFADLRQEIDAMPEIISSSAMRVVRRIGIVLVPLVVLSAVVPGRRLEQARAMMSVIEDYAKEVIEECGTAKWLFTDGSYDPYLELLAASSGRALRVVTMIPYSGKYDAYLRTRGVTDAEDKLSLEVGGGMALRSWMRDKKDRLQDVALQLGFELWKRDGEAVPPCSGVLSRPVGMSEEERVRGVENARKLSDRIIDLYAKGGPASNAGAKINDAFLFAQWRLARIARMRAECADYAGDVKSAIEDVKLSEKLDENNSSLKSILNDMEKVRNMVSRQITPREGLQMALTRADFTLARRYAEPILQADPDEPQANFGMGMSYFVQEQWTRAEEYLRRCLVRNPKEPAVYNNLAILQMKTGRFDAAEKNARRALELVPASAEVKDTLKQVLEAREDAIDRARKAKKRAEEARRRAEEAEEED